MTSPNNLLTAPDPGLSDRAASLEPDSADAGSGSFTPGPWIYGIRRDGSIWLSLGDHKKGPHFQADLCASVPDANLICVSRELLAALQDVQEELCSWIDRSSHNRIRGADNNSVIKARAAIAKALGSQP